MKFVRERLGILTVGAVAVVLLWGWFLRPPLSLFLLAVLVVMLTAATISNGVYVLRRIALLLPVLFLISLFTFWLVSSLPGDPAVNALGPGATPQAVAEVREELGLDEPFWVQYGDWLGDTVKGDLGFSYIRREDVNEALGNAYPVTLQLLLYAQIVAIGIAIPLGVYSAYRANTKADSAISTASFGMLALPNYVVAVLLVLFLALGGISIAGTDVGSTYFPGARYVPFGESPTEHFKSMALPALSLAAAQIAVYMRLLRTDMIATLQQNFIDVARAKGLSDRKILWRHALRPSSFTLLTVIGLNIGTLLGGTVIIETIFTLPGVGGLLLGSVFNRDYVVIQGVVLTIAAGYVLVLFAVDLLYYVLDPRLRTSHAR
jgi:peptide/nickel transport system permease protein